MSEPTLKIKTGKSIGDKTLWLDGVDISRFVTGVQIDIDVTGRPTARIELTLRDTEIDLEDAEIIFSESERSREIREMLKTKAQEG
jgi:hypothetical protein